MKKGLGDTHYRRRATHSRMPKKRRPTTPEEIRAAVLTSIRGTVTEAPDLLTLVRWIGAPELEVAKALRWLVRRRLVKRHDSRQRLSGKGGKWVPWVRYRLTPKGERET